MFRFWGGLHATKRVSRDTPSVCRRLILVITDPLRNARVDFAKQNRVILKDACWFYHPAIWRGPGMSQLCLSYLVSDLMIL